jgi:vitamin B12 transporter
MRLALVLAGLVGVASPALAQLSTDSTPPAVHAASELSQAIREAPAASEPSEANRPSRAPAPVATYAEGVVVTATLDEEEAEEVPASVTVIGAEEIETRRATEVADLLRTVPGLALVRSGSPGKVTSLFVRGAASTQTLVLWNGLRLNDPMFGGYDWAFLPTEGVERVEVVRGPFSALYGGDAAGGVVQVLTGRRRGGSLQLEAGEDAYRRAALAAGFGAGAPDSQLHLDVTGHVRRGDGVLDNDFFDGDEATARLSWEPRPGVSLGLLARGNDSEVGVPLGFGGVPTPHHVNRRESRELAAPFRIDRAEWEVEGHAGRVASDLEAEDPDDPFAASATEAETLLGRAVVTWRPGGLGAGGSGTGGAGGGGFWIAGGGDWQEQEASTASAFSSLDDVTQTTRAAFAQAHWQRARWTLEAGLRHDDSDRFGGETSVRLGTVAALAPSLRLHASYGEAFRAPTLSDLFLPFFGNPDLHPETTASSELGIEGGDGRWSWSVTGFTTDFENLIVFSPPNFRAENVGRAESRGVEASAGFAAGRFHGRVEATWLEAENLDTGEPLVRRPEESASLVVSWAPGPWTLSAAGRHVGERPDLGGIVLPAHRVLDLAASWAARPWLEPFVRVDNALDEEYEEVADFPAPGRTLAGGVALRF